jgi:hypothetical protein
MNTHFIVNTPEGAGMEGYPGDYLVCDAEMTHAWPVKKDIFESTYVKVAMRGTE